MQRFQTSAILAGLLLASTGCATMSDWQGWNGFSSDEKPEKSEKFAAREQDDGDPGLTPAELRKSRNSAGLEDGFDFKHMQSSEARRIEQSLGFE